MDDKTRKVFRSMMMITQIGISMLVPIFICGAIGIWINRLTNTQVFFLLMLFIGIGAAFRNVYILTKSFYENDMNKEHERLDYIKGLKEYRNSQLDKTYDEGIIEKKKRYPENRGETRN